MYKFYLIILFILVLLLVIMHVYKPVYISRLKYSVKCEDAGKKLDAIKKLLRYGEYGEGIIINNYPDGENAAKIIISFLRGDCNETESEINNMLLHISAENNYPNTITIGLLMGNDVNAKNAKYLTPLNLAASNGHLNLCNQLISLGADVDIDEGLFTVLPIHSAVFSNNLEIVRLLIINGARIDSRDCEGKTALHYAVKQSNEKIVRFLIEKGAKINVQDELGETPLHYSVRADNMIIAMVLLQEGADYQRQSIFGETPQGICENPAISSLMKE